MMETEYFVDEDSIVRRIWGRSETILFIFAGAAAEFALNKAVDWLYFTGKLPKDPLGRLFSTVSYARAIVFSTTEKAHRAIDSIAAIHADVQNRRGQSIPDWAYRDVLFMLVGYSIAAFELLERPMTLAEKTGAFNVFHRVGSRMGIRGLPETFIEWQRMRGEHLAQNLEYSHLTDDLFKQYKKHLGDARFAILVESQKLVVPMTVRKMLGFSPFSWLKPMLPLYRLLSRIKADAAIKWILIPSRYKPEVAALDIAPGCPFKKFTKKLSNPKMSLT